MKISVLTPVFNSAAYIERAIQSVLDQDYQDWEHIVVDGGSTDGTVDILNTYSHLLWVSEPDNGQSDAMNKAFQRSNGSIIVYLNADDWFEPGVFSAVAGHFMKNEHSDVLVGNLYFRYEDNRPEKIDLSQHDIRKIILPFRFGFPYNPVAYFYRREVQERVGHFPHEEHFAMDYWFIIRAFAKPSVVDKIHMVFGTYYHTGENKSSLGSNDKLDEMVRTTLSTINKDLYFYYYSRKVLHVILRLPLSYLTILAKCLVVFVLRFKLVKPVEMKNKGFRYFISGNK